MRKVGRPRKYEGTHEERVRQSQLKYRKSRLGKKSLKAYRASPEGKEAVTKAKRKWELGEKGIDYRINQALERIEKALNLIAKLMGVEIENES